MIQRNFDAIAKTDVDALVNDRVTEMKTLEYKRELPGGKTENKKEFLADVSSFANASGGDIIYGIKPAVDADCKKTGAPEQPVEPIVGCTVDEAKLRLENMIRDGIAPRLRVDIKEVLGWNDDGRGFVILLRIAKSFASPHMVTLEGTSRFFSRHSAGKFQLDVGQIRSAFLATESQAERIKRFREDRLGQIVADETPVALGPRHRLVLHMIPIASFLNNERLDMTNENALLNAFPPIAGRNLTSRHNLDGFVIWIPARGQSQQQTHGFGYCQVFSHGAIEAVAAGSVLGGKTDDGRNVIVSDYEPDVVQAVETYLAGFKSIGLRPPVAIAISLLGCKGATLYPLGWDRGRQTYSIDRDTAILPDVVVESFDVSVPQVMKPMFDVLWNACGFPRSFNYDQYGNWKPIRE